MQEEYSSDESQQNLDEVFPNMEGDQSSYEDSDDSDKPVPPGE
jgi:hypothetical protein